MQANKYTAAPSVPTANSNYFLKRVFVYDLGTPEQNIHLNIHIYIYIYIYVIRGPFAHSVCNPLLIILSKSADPPGRACRTPHLSSNPLSFLFSFFFSFPILRKHMAHTQTPQTIIETIQNNSLTIDTRQSFFLFH